MTHSSKEEQVLELNRADEVQFCQSCPSPEGTDLSPGVGIRCHQVPQQDLLTALCQQSKVQAGLSYSRSSATYRLKGADPAIYIYMYPDS